MAKLLAISLFIFISFLTIAHADDTSFGGTGSSPMPIESTDVKMLDEHVSIAGHEIDKENMKGEWKVSCDFTFENTTDKPIELKVGFPFPIYEEDSNVTSPAGITIKKGDALVYNFNVEVDGKKVSATRQIIEPNINKGLNYKDAYIWKMNFLPHQIVKVHHDYLTGVTFNVMGHTVVNYVLLTGGLWKDGTIGTAKIEIIPNTVTGLCNEVEKNDADYLKPKPPGLQIIGTGAERKYVWDFQNYRPTEDVDVCLQTGKNYVRYHLIYPLLNNLKDQIVYLNKMNAKGLRILRNAIYAQYGKHFVSPDLQDYFDRQWWYQPNPNYSDNLLTKEDREVIAIIQKVETQKQH